MPSRVRGVPARLHFRPSPPSALLGRRPPGWLRASTPVHARRALADAWEAAPGRGPVLGLGLHDGRRLVGVWCARHDATTGVHPPTAQLLAAAVAPNFRHIWPELVERGCDLIRRADRASAIAIVPDAVLSSEPQELARVLGGLGYREESSTASSGPLRFTPEPKRRKDPTTLPVDARLERDGRLCEVRIVRSETHWSWLEPFWDALVEASPGATVFQTHAVLRAWWDHFSSGARLWIHTFWESDRLLGIAPLMLRTVSGPLGYRTVIRFIGELPEIHRPRWLFGSDASLCSQALAECLCDGVEFWDELDLHEQPPDTDVLEPLRRRGYLTRAEPDSADVTLSLERSFDRFFASCSRNQRQNVRSAVRKLEASGALAYERASAARDVALALARYRELEQRSWKSEEPFAVGAPERAPYVDSLARALGPSGHFQIALLTLDGRPIAGTIGLAHAARFHHLEIAYDEDFARFSPGMVLEYLELRDLFDRGGYVEYDFLGGNLDHKRRWVPDVRPQVRIYARRRSLRAGLQLIWLRGLRPLLGAALAPWGGLDRARRVHTALRDGVRRMLAPR